MLSLVHCCFYLKNLKSEKAFPLYLDKITKHLLKTRRLWRCFTHFDVKVTMGK